EFPLVNAAQATYGGNTDAFVAKLNAQGTALVYSTYLGGSNSDSAAGIAVEKTSGGAFVTGVTNSANFPTKTPYQAAVKGSRDVFITKLDPSGALAFSTYLGGGADDYGQSVAIDGSNNVYVTGYTSSTNFPTTAGAVQTTLKGNPTAFVTKLSSSGTALEYSTYLGGTCVDWGYGIAVHSSGSAYVTGETCSTDFPTTAGAVGPQKEMGNAAFVTRLKPDGTGLVYSTYIGSNRQVRGSAIAVDESEFAYVTGFNYGEDFPTSNALQKDREWYVPVLAYSKTGGVEWDSLQRGMSGNSVPAISVDPRDTATIVVAERGINRSTDGGQNWTHTDLWNNATALARSASNPNVLYTATGNGMYKSTDNGVDWQRLGANPAGTVYMLAVHPTDPAKVTAATSSGIFQSSDGVNWTTKNTGLLNLIVYDWDCSPTDPKVQYAATAGGVFKTVDEAATWSLAGVGLPVNFPALDLAVSPADANTVYVLLGNGILYRSTDAGANWNVIGSGIRGSVALFALAPSNPLIMYAITSRACYRSRDGGVTWTQVSNLGQVLGLTVMEVDPKNADLIYVGLTVLSDVFVSKISPSGTAFAYSTLLGGQSSDSGMGIAADNSGNAYISGTGNAPFPTTAGSFSRVIGGAFIAKIADTQAACTYVVRPGDVANEVSIFYSGGGEGRFFVIAPSGCAWEVISNVPWITIPGGNNSGVGVGPVWIDVDANTGPARQGTVTIAGQTRLVSQAAGTCTYQRSVEALAAPAAGGTFTVAITTTPDCGWVASANQGWFTVTPDIGSGSGTLTITVQSNPGASSRVAAVVIGGYGVVVSQIGATSTFAFNPAAVNVPANASTGSFAVTTNLTSASWRAVSTQSWLTVTSGPNFTGSVSVNYGVEANTGTAARTAQILVGNVVFTLTQAGLPATTPMITSINAAGGGPDIALNTWIEIKGANLAPTDLGPYGFTWSTAPEFASGKMPTQLRNVSVTVNGKPSYVYFISPAQVNVLTGLDSTTGKVQVVVTNGANSSQAFTVNVRARAPGFFLFGATKYIASTHADGSLLGPASMSVPGYQFTPAKPNETVVLYANGFGVPSTPLVEGSATQFSPLPSLPLILIGGVQATVAYAGVVTPGLYQFNVVVPANAPDGDNSVTATYSGFTTAPGALITVQK
ncbi:MAG: SBBP repeat-containing protein, partial [Bryobacteraceae bacterium]